MPPRTLKENAIAITVLIGLILGLAVALTLWSGPSPPGWTLETLEQKESDALELIQDRFRPSAFAIANAPVAVAAGEWSSSVDVMNCTPESQCFDIDFNMPSINIKCEWLVSYDRATADLKDYRALNEAARNLFQEAPPIPQAREDLQGKAFWETADGSTTSDAIRLIRTNYLPKDPTLFSGSQAGWFAIKKNTLANGDDVIAVRFSESKADTPSEWIVEMSQGVHDQYQLLGTNGQATIDFVRKQKSDH